MYYKLKEKLNKDGTVMEGYINTKLDMDTVYEISQSIEACADFSIYDCFREAYTKAWNKLLDVLKTETDNIKAIDTTSVIMSRARAEVS